MPPKALLFDVGGVCVVSPFQAILDYELAHHIPPGYINHTISSTSPNGAWQKAERGEIILNDDFFAQFKTELEDPSRWQTYWQRMLSDPKKADLIPDRYKGKEIPPVTPIDAKAMFWNMMKMARSPDPYMYPALKKLGQSGKFVVAALSNTIAFPEGICDENGRLFINGIPKKEVVQVSGGDASAINPDEREDVKSNFETFVSSAHVGMRKPERRIYELAIQQVQSVGKQRGIDIEASDIIFLDDIGGNLKAAKQMGMGTIKVNLGRTKEAVKELEQAVGMSLLPETSRL